MCDLLNSAGRCSAICDQTGSRRRAEGRPAEGVVGRLEHLAVLGVPPHHQVGVGAQAADVVDPAHDDVLLGLRGEQRLDLGRLGVAVGGAEHVAQLEDRPHRVADGVVEFPGPGLPCRWPCGSLCRGDLGGRPMGRRDDRRDADPVTPGAAHGQPGRQRGAHAGDAVEVADGVLRQPAAPPLHVRVDGYGGDAGQLARSSASDRATSASSVACRVDLLPRAPQRGAQDATSPPASRTQSHLAKEKVLALIARCSTGGTRKPERSTSPSTAERGEGERHHGHARRLDPPRRRPRPQRGRRRPAGERSGAAGVASTTRRARTVSGRVRGPDGERPAVAVTAQLAHRRVEPDLEPAGHDGRAAGPCRRPGRRRRGRRSAARRRPGRGASRRRAIASSCGTVAAADSSPGATGVDAAEQRLDEPVHDLVAQAGRDEVADGDVVVERRCRSRARSRASPAGESTPDAASSSTSKGTPISERGIGRSSPRDKMREVAAVGCTTSRPRSMRPAPPPRAAG